MKPFKLIIFDLDGTLVDAYKAIEYSLNFTLKKIGLKPQTPLAIRRAVGWGDEKLLEKFIPRGSLAEALRIYRRHHRQSLLKYAQTFAGAKTVLRRLKSCGIKLAIASNRPTKFCGVLLRHLNLDKYFSLILCADGIRHYKPHPEILNTARKQLGFRKHQSLYVGDMAVDVQTAKSARIKSVAVLTGSSTRGEIIKSRPWRIIRDISYLPGVLQLK